MRVIWKLGIASWNTLPRTLDYLRCNYLCHWDKDERTQTTMGWSDGFMYEG